MEGGLRCLLKELTKSSKQYMWQFLLIKGEKKNERWTASSSASSSSVMTRRRFSTPGCCGSRSTAPCWRSSQRSGRKNKGIRVALRWKHPLQHEIRREAFIRWFFHCISEFFSIILWMLEITSQVGPVDHHTWSRLLMWLVTPSYWFYLTERGSCCSIAFPSVYLFGIFMFWIY